jgi:lysozyme family protein
MTKRVDDIINEVIQIEAGYVNHPADRGGPTRYGITEAVARANGYKGAMQNLPRAFAHQLLKKRYFIEPGFEAAAEISREIAEELTDTGVNMGPPVATRFLQVALNALNRDQQDYADIDEDGQLGPVTLRTLRAFLDKRGRLGEQVMLTALNCQQGARYIDIVRRDASQEAFIFGWLANRVVL